MAETSVTTTGQSSTAGSAGGASGGTGVAPASPSATPSAGAASTGSQGYTYGGKTYNSVEDLGKAYESLNSEHGKWTQKAGDLEKQVQQYQPMAELGQKWAQWWQNVQPYWGGDVEELLKKKLMGQGMSSQQAGQTAQQAVQQAQNSFEGWDGMRPEEQFTKFREMTYRDVGNALRQYMSGMQSQLQQEFQKKEQWYQNYLQNYLGLMRQGLEQKVKNPNFDLDKTMSRAAEALSGKIDPLQLGQQLISAGELDAQLEAAKKAAYEQGKQDFELEQKNKAMEAAPSLGAAPKFKMPVSPNGTRQGLGTLRESAAARLQKDFGSQAFL